VPSITVASRFLRWLVWTAHDECHYYTDEMTAEYAMVNSLGQFIDCVSELRSAWSLPKHKELWFRGESRDYGETILRPELYRPAKEGMALKPIPELLEIENDLHDEFQRNAVEHASTTADDDWDWDSYVLMQHHE